MTPFDLMRHVALVTPGVTGQAADRTATGLQFFGTYIYPAVLLPVGVLVGLGMALIWRQIQSRRRERRVAGLPDAARDLAIKYEAFNEIRDLDGDPRDRDNRIKMMNRAFDQMQNYARRLGDKLNRPALGFAGREGYSVLLFAAVAVAPKRIDGKLILGINDGLLSGNAQHKAVDAIGELFRHPELVLHEERAALLTWLDNMPNKESKLPERIAKLREAVRL